MQRSPYNENVGSNISLSQAERWIQRYQQQHPRPRAGRPRKEPTYATFFGRKFTLDFMDRWDNACVGLRVYQAIDDTDPTTFHRHRVVLIAVDRNGNDLLDKPQKEADGLNDVAGDDGLNCPDHCSGTGTLLGR